MAHLSMRVDYLKPVIAHIYRTCSSWNYQLRKISVH